MEELKLHEKIAQQLVDKHRLVLIWSGTEAGDEILCTVLAKQHAEISVNAILDSMEELHKIKFYENVIKSIKEI
jgi:hypothetical protein